MSSTPVIAAGLGIITAASYATSIAGIVRINGGVLQNRGGGNGSQNIRSGALSLVGGNFARLGRFALRGADRAALAVAESISGATGNLLLNVEPGKLASCPTT